MKFTPSRHSCHAFIFLALSLSCASLFNAQAAYSGRNYGNYKNDLCANAARDNDIFWDNRLGHNSFDAVYRAPFGAVRNDQGSVTLRFRTCFNDASQVRLRVWNSVEGREYWYAMTPDFRENDPGLGPVQYWKTSIPIGNRASVLYYFFMVIDGSKSVYYVANDPRTLGGGWGRFTNSWDDGSSYQITIYEKDFHVANWIKGAVIYQIFPDRFRNGDKTNDPVDNQGFVYGLKTRFHDWNKPLCDPLAKESPCHFEPDNQFYGGDLQGIIEKLDYLKSLGVNAIYLNPIFRAATNHRYDTQNHLEIEPSLGNMNTFHRLTAEARSRGMQIIIDGVLNHTSADSPYFDLYGRWDGAGACENPNSPFKNWYFLPHRNDANKARNNTAKRPWEYAYCPSQPPGSNRRFGTSYEAWAGYFELPVLNWANAEVRNYFYSGGPSSVGPYWIHQGAAGWRLDVAGLLDSGQATATDSGVWEDFRIAIKSENPDAIMIGEEWGNSSNWLLGREWDTSMNYRFRTSVLNWLFDGCSGSGCYGGVVFEDNDFNSGSIGNYQGPISSISESDFEQRLMSIQENYPPESWHAMMNLVDSHDTSRALFLLKKGSRDDAALARKKLAFLSIFQFTYPGAPTVYYGDEVGVGPDDVWYEGRWLDDPYNRAVYPWAEEGMQPDLELLGHYQRLGQIRNSNMALKLGNYATVLTDNTRRLLAFYRSYENDRALVVLNRNSSEGQNVDLRVGSLFPDGSTLEDVLNGGFYSVSGGQIRCGSIPPLWGRVLVQRNK